MNMPPDHKPDSLQNPAPVPQRPPAPPAGASLNYYSLINPAEREAYAALCKAAACPRGALCAVLSFAFAMLVCEMAVFSRPGISAPVLLLAFYGLLFRVFRDRPIPRAARHLCIPGMLLALSPFLHANPSTVWIVYGTLCAVLCCQIVLVGLGERAPEVFSLKMVRAALYTVFVRPFSGIALPFHALGALRGIRSKGLQAACAVLGGLLVAVPLGGILLALFMSADAAYSDAVSRWIKLLGDNPLRYAGDAVLGGILGLFLGAALLHLHFAKGTDKAARVFPGVHALSVGTFLGAICALVLSFVFFQLSYLFGGDSGRVYYELTYSEYARRGFFELCWASGLLFCTVLAALLCTRRAPSGKLSTAVRALSLMLCLSNAVLLLSAVQRMLLYVSAYGLSMRRLCTLWAMALIGLGLVFLSARCCTDRVAILRSIGFLALAGVCALGLVNTERMVARYNIDRALAGGGEIDFSYFGSLSYTVLPELARIEGTPLEATFQEARWGTPLKVLMAEKGVELENGHALYSFSLDVPGARAVVRDRVGPDPQAVLREYENSHREIPAITSEDFD